MSRVRSDLEKEAGQEAENIVRGRLLDMLLEARDPETGRAMQDSEIVDNLLPFITAGHETSSSVSLTAFTNTSAMAGNKSGAFSLPYR